MRKDSVNLNENISSAIYFYSYNVYIFEKKNMVPIKIKIKGFREKCYRTLLWQLKFKK